ncbi:hypothetical protein D9M69_466220 [compost metagenome]
MVPTVGDVRHSGHRIADHAWPVGETYPARINSGWHCLSQHVGAERLWVLSDLFHAGDFPAPVVPGTPSCCADNGLAALYRYSASLSILAWTIHCVGLAVPHCADADDRE